MLPNNLGYAKTSRSARLTSHHSTGEGLQWALGQPEAHGKPLAQNKTHTQQLESPFKHNLLTRVVVQGVADHAFNLWQRQADLLCVQSLPGRHSERPYLKTTKIAAVEQTTTITDHSAFALLKS